MKPLPTVLLCAVVCAAGILVYDQLQRGTASTARSAGDTALEAADAPGDAPARLRTTGLAEGGAIDARLAAQDTRLAKIKAAVEAVSLELKTFREVWMKSGPHSRSGADDENPLPEGDGAAFDDHELGLMERRMAEITRRRKLQMRKETVASHLKMLDLGLDQTAQADLFRAILAFQGESDVFWKNVRERRLDYKEQKVVFQTVVNQYRDEIFELIKDKKDAADVARRFVGAGAVSRENERPMPLGPGRRGR